jgi:hypothetical protein
MLIDILKFVGNIWTALDCIQLIIMFIFFLVVWIKQGCRAPMFVHCIAIAGALIVLLILCTVPQKEPLSSTDYLDRILLFPAAVYLVFVFFGGPGITLEDENQNRGTSIRI